MTRRRKGQLAEKLAVRYLKEKGYRVLATNFRSRYGEIDIIATQGNQLVFVEVRSKTGTGYGTPEESVTRAKKDKLVATCECFRQQNSHVPENYRIDVIAIMLGEDNRLASLKHFVNAIEVV